jgi:hypothetical protein
MGDGTHRQVVGGTVGLLKLQGPMTPLATN